MVNKMKRLLTIILMLCLSAGTAFAQNSEAQKRIHMAAERISSRIDVDDSDKDAFFAIYKSYKKEMAAVRSIKPSITGDSEQAIEAKIRSDFAKSEKIIEIRKKYYDEFRSILRPSQIQQMYDIERSWMDKGN